MLCSNKQMVLAINWKRFFEKDPFVVFFMEMELLFFDLPMQRKIDGLLILSLTPDPAFVTRFFVKSLPVVLDAYRYLLNRTEILHWLPAFSPAGYATYFDGLAHALALLSGLDDDNQRQQAECYVQSLAT